MSRTRTILMEICQRAGLETRIGFERGQEMFLRSAGDRPCAYIAYTRSARPRAGFDDVAVYFGGADPEASRAKVRGMLERSLEVASVTEGGGEWPSMTVVARAKARILNATAGGGAVNPSEPSVNYMYFEAAQAGSTVSLKKSYAYAKGDAPDLEYSSDGVTFTEWPYTTETTTMGGFRHTFDPITLASVGDRVYLRGDNESFGDSYSTDSSVFLLSGRLHCGGDIRSIFARDLSATVARFHPNMCASSGDHFALLNAPDIRVWQSVATDAFNGFLSYCEAVTELPSDYLPWTELAEGCYRGMFIQSGIRKAPVLPAAYVPSRAYAFMLFQCANLAEIEAHATELAEGATASMTVSVAASGVFRKAAAMEDWPQGADGIPEGWTVENV